MTTRLVVRAGGSQDSGAAPIGAGSQSPIPVWIHLWILFVDTSVDTFVDTSVDTSRRHGNKDEAQRR